MPKSPLSRAPQPVQHLARWLGWRSAAPRTLVIACSGGRDSVALTLAAHELTKSPELWLALLAYHDLPAATAPPELVLWHLDHGLREDSCKDARFVQHLAERLGRQCIIEQARLAEAAALPGVNLEALAREERYARLARFAQQPPAEHALTAPLMACTAHHLRDQAETVLHHLLRGTALAGLRGIAAEYMGCIHRPWLALDPAAIEEYLSELGQDYREDETNTDLRLTRNRLRHQVLPVLRELNPLAEAHLARLARLAAEAERLMDAALSALPLESVSERELGQRLPLFATLNATYRVIHNAVGWGNTEVLGAAVLRMLRGLFGSLKYDEYGLVHTWAEHPVHILHLRELAVQLLDGQRLSVQSTSGQAVDLPHFMLTQDSTVSAPSGLQMYLRPAGHTEIGIIQSGQGAPWQIRSWPRDLPVILEGKPGQIAFRCLLPQYVRFPLSLRLPREGDRIQLAGGGTKKLGNIFTDAKIPLTFRRAWAVLVDATDHVLWLPGLEDSAAMRDGQRRSAWLVNLRPAG